MKAGQLVRVTRDCLGLDVDRRATTNYYQAGTVATLMNETPHGWWADFNNGPNPVGSFKLNRVDPTRGDWFIPHNAMVPM